MLHQFLCVVFWNKKVVLVFFFLLLFMYSFSMKQRFVNFLKWSNSLEDSEIDLCRKHSKLITNLLNHIGVSHCSFIDTLCSAITTTKNSPQLTWKVIGSILSVSVQSIVKIMRIMYMCVTLQPIKYIQESCISPGMQCHVTML